MHLHCHNNRLFRGWQCKETNALLAPRVQTTGGTARLEPTTVNEDDDRSVATSAAAAARRGPHVKVQAIFALLPRSGLAGGKRQWKSEKKEANVHIEEAHSFCRRWGDALTLHVIQSNGSHATALYRTCVPRTEAVHETAGKKALRVEFHGVFRGAGGAHRNPPKGGAANGIE